MRGVMPVFTPSFVFGDCEQCGERFDPVKGGVCAACSRILCGTHLFGSRAYRLRAVVGLPAVCVACRNEGRRVVRGGTGDGGGGAGKIRTGEPRIPGTDGAGGAGR